MQRTLRMMGLSSAAMTVLAAGALAAQPPDTARTTRPAARSDTARAAPRRDPRTTSDSARRAGDLLRPTARDRVRADDPTCDDLRRRERMMDSLYGKDRERLPRAAGARTPPKTPAMRAPATARRMP